MTVLYLSNQNWDWAIATFCRGLSQAERAKLPNSDIRKRTYSFGDEEGNNLVPYEWDKFGPGSFFGQEASCWCHLPNPL